jgi:hypothetical protein
VTLGLRTQSDPLPKSAPQALLRVALLWHNHGMARTRVSTTVDEDLLESARRLRSQLTDSALLDEALRALVARHRATEIDKAYSVYEQHPLDEPDEWGDLASFRDSAAKS